jgi:hypothetical protein
MTTQTPTYDSTRRSEGRLMATRIEWKYREAMVQRGARMLLAHWRNRCEAADLERWYRRALPRYAAFTSGVGKDNRDAVRRAFWRDCEKRVLGVKRLSDYYA